MEYVPGLGRVAIMLGHPRQNGSRAHVLDKIVGNRIGADTKHDTRFEIPLETLQRRAITHERGRAMSDTGRGLTQQVDIEITVPTNPRAVIRHNRMAQDHSFAK